MRHSTMLATAAFATLLATSAFAADLPGKGITVKPAQSTISEESFQTLLVSRALEKLGYTVEKPSEVDYNVAYTSIAAGDTTFIATNWQPLHDDMYAAAGGDNKFYRKGVYVSGAAQGYLIDKKTAEQYHITSIDQLKDPQIAKLFDTNNDGKADLTADCGYLSPSLVTSSTFALPFSCFRRPSASSCFRRRKSLLDWVTST